MIISASRRTDIPAFYSKWFIDKIKRGYCLKRNPFNYNMKRKISLNKEDVDGIVFWSKNPSPIFPFLEDLKDFPYYFLFTLNSYEQDIEVKVPPKDFLVSIFKKFSDKIGKERVIWRYDPIIFTKKYSFEYHLKSFDYYMQRLKNYTNICIFSFFDYYKKLKKRTETFLFPQEETKIKLIEHFSKISSNYGIELRACSEMIDYSSLGVYKSACIDKKLLEKISGKKIVVDKDRYQRKECLCSQSTDIGFYNTCGYQCSYCYAVNNYSSSLSNLKKHNPDSDFLI